MNIKDGNIEDTRQPPDEPEAQFCEDCGEEMEEDKWGDWMKHYMKCTNKFCPSKFNAGEVAFDMAEYLAEVEQDLRDTKAALKYAWVYITKLTEKIEKLTRSQHE